MNSDIKNLFVLKLTTLSLLFILIVSGSQNIFSVETLFYIGLAYVALKFSFYALLFSMKIDNTINTKIVPFFKSISL